MHTSLPTEQYDYLIVGTSPAGLGAASRLSRHRLERSIDSRNPATNQKKPKSGERSYHKQKQWMSDITDAKSPLSGAEEHSDFRVTL